MVKKSVVYGALLATVCMSPTLAGSFYKSGFLAGAQVGVSFGNGKYNSTLYTNPNLANNSFAASGSGRKTAALFGLLGGYRHIFNQDFTFGLILEANFLTTNEIKKSLFHTSTNLQFDNKVKKTFTLIPTVALGKVFCGRWHASLGLGLAVARFRQQVNSVNVNPSLSASASSTKIGFVPSIGVEYAATQNVSVIGSVAYEIYGKIRKNLTNAAYSSAQSSYTTSAKPNYLTLKVGAVYRF